jgi:hypothetical protein
MMPHALRVECSLILHSYRIEHRANTTSANLSALIGIGIAIVVGFDINPDTDCDSDTESRTAPCRGEPCVRQVFYIAKRRFLICGY